MAIMPMTQKIRDETWKKPRLSPAVVWIRGRMVNRRQQPTEPQTLTRVINTYYYQIPGVDSVSYENGFTGYSKDGDKAENLPPVIWIEPAEAPSNPARFQKET